MPTADRASEWIIGEFISLSPRTRPGPWWTITTSTIREQAAPPTLDAGAARTMPRLPPGSRLREWTFIPFLPIRSTLPRNRSRLWTSTFRRPRDGGTRPRRASSPPISPRRLRSMRATSMTTIHSNPLTTVNALTSELTVTPLKLQKPRRLRAEILSPIASGSWKPHKPTCT